MIRRLRTGGRDARLLAALRKGDLAEIIGANRTSFQRYVEKQERGGRPVVVCVVIGPRHDPAYAWAVCEMRDGQPVVTEVIEPDPGDRRRRPDVLGDGQDYYTAPIQR